MKKIISKITVIFLFITLFFSASAKAESKLTRIQKLACETILCLSSAIRPGECNPSLDYFFGIKKDDLSDTLDARRAFLKKCPDSSAPGMPSLIDAIVDYSRPYCTVEALNNNKIDVIVQYGSRFNPKSKHIKVVNPEMPFGCRRYYNALINHEYTAYTQITYVGQKINGRTYEDENGDEYIVVRGNSNTAQELLKNHWEWVQ